MIKITHLPEQQADETGSDLSVYFQKSSGLQWQFHMCGIYFDNSWKSQPQSIKAVLSSL